MVLDGGWLDESGSRSFQRVLEAMEHGPKVTFRCVDAGEILFDVVGFR